MRLATLEIIRDKLPIEEGANRIELLSIRDKTVVVRRGIHRIGERVIYIKVGAFLPQGKPFCDIETLQLESHDGCLGYPVKRVRINGQISEGLVIPLSAFSYLPSLVSEMTPGADLTRAINVRSYREEVQLSMRGDH